MNEFQEKLKKKMHEYVRFVYRVTKKFPRDEIYGATSQIRRAAVSIILNYIEGYARRRPKQRLNFLEMSYGSLRESKYLLVLSRDENYLNSGEYEEGRNMTEEIGAMVWTEISNIEKIINTTNI